MRRLAVMAHFDPRGEVAPHVRRQIRALGQAVDRLVVVSTAELTPQAESWLGAHSELVRRANYGYDFFSYRTGLLEAEELHDYDHVVICNDSFVGPLVPYAEVLSTMDDQRVDFWGLTKTDRVAPHVQSFFVCFRQWVVRSRAFTTFWLRMSSLSDRSQVIRRYEVGLSTTLTGAGFAAGSYFTENDRDRRVARERMWWWAALLTQKRSPRARRAAFVALAREPWNPCAGLADRALDGGRLPFVKIDTLRYDPYGLQADRLLTACEREYPEAFDGVRAFLRETAAMYPPRPSEVLPTPHPVLRPFGRMVRYA